MKLDYNLLSQQMPPEALVWAGFGGSLNLNFVRLTGDAVTPESSFLEGFLSLLDAALQAQSKVNTERLREGMNGIDAIIRTIDVDNTTGKTFVSYMVRAEIDISAALSNVIDPTEATDPGS